MTEHLSKIVSHEIREAVLARCFENRYLARDTWVDEYGNNVFRINLELDYPWYNDDGDLLTCGPNYYLRETENKWSLEYDFDDFDDFDCGSPVEYILMAFWDNVDGRSHNFAVPVTRNERRKHL